MKIDIEECYNKYAPMVYRRCSSLLKNEDEALDAAQDVFVNLLRHQTKLHGQFLSSLLYTIATNVCLNRLRQRKRQSMYEPQASQPNTNEGYDFDPQFEAVEKHILVEDILRNESESTRAICFMYHSDEMTLREIGETVGLSISGVRKRILAFNARAKVKVKGEPI